MRDSVSEVHAKHVEAVGIAVFVMVSFSVSEQHVGSPVSLEWSNI